MAPMGTVFWWTIISSHFTVRTWAKDSSKWSKSHFTDLLLGFGKALLRTRKGKEQEAWYSYGESTPQLEVFIEDSKPNDTHEEVKDRLLSEGYCFWSPGWCSDWCCQEDSNRDLGDGDVVLEVEPPLVSLQGKELEFLKKSSLLWRTWILKIRLML